MANGKLAVVGMLVIILLLKASGGAVTRHHHGAKRPDRCGGVHEDEDDSPEPGMLRHRERHRCPSPARHGTPAVMTANGFQRGQDGGGPAACDGKFHSDNDLVVALSTRWFAGGRRCHAGIRITSKHSGRTVVARVVDECDSRRGCKDNIVDTSAAVWKALGLDVSIGEAPVTWSDA